MQTSSASSRKLGSVYNPIISKPSSATSLQLLLFFSSLPGALRFGKSGSPRSRVTTSSFSSISHSPSLLRRDLRDCSDEEGFLFLLKRPKKLAVLVMSRYDWVFFTMPLSSNGNRSEEASETEPILHQSTDTPDSREMHSSFEIGMVGNDDEEELVGSNADEQHNLVNPDQLQCRICLDTGGEDLIAPCHCRGTQKYVHRSCLDNWRSTKEGFAFAHCTECRAMFILRANVPPDRWWLRLKFQLLVLRDHTFIFVIVQLVVAFLGMLVYRFYGEELREMFGYEQHPYGFYSMAVLAVILVGLLYGFFIAIICGQRINERHYHVLAKQELTKLKGDAFRKEGFLKSLKEYVVENRDENMSSPELDPSHVTELRMLGLY